MAALKPLLFKLYENLEALRQQEALRGGPANTPLDLRNQINYHWQAIERVEQFLPLPLTASLLAELKTDLEPLVLLNDTYRDDVAALKPEIPPLPFEPETVPIPAGPFLMGSQPDEEISSHEAPQHQVDLPAYHIGKYPLTVEQYAEFIRQTNHRAPKKAGWFGQNPPRNRLDHPVVAVSWYDALAYCAWLEEQTGRPYRLPTEAEWEKAARGTDGRRYPWGNDWDASRCNCANSKTTPVAAHPAGQSPYGCHDMVGNVWEWTTTLWGRDWQESDFAYPYQAHDGREAPEAEAAVYRLFRGGDYDDALSQLRCSARRWYAPTHADKARGFRVALEMEH